MNGVPDYIKRTAKPATLESMAAEIAALGVVHGDILIVHSSLSRIGFVIGGAAAVIAALEIAINDNGTLAMPSHSTDNDDPTQWNDPPVPETWYEDIRRHMPAYQKDLTPTFGIGVIPEVFRKQNGTFRSDHPWNSWCARGPHAEKITSGHALSMATGDTSPVAKLYDLGAKVLFIGTDYTTNTAFHLAEYRNRFAPLKKCNRQAAMMINGQRQWISYDDIYLYSKDFPELGAAFEEGHEVKKGRIGQADCKLFHLQQCVDFSVQWMNKNRWLD